MHRYLKHCSYFQKLGQLYSLPCDSETVDINLKEHLIKEALNNCRITGQTNNWSQLSNLEVYYIKTFKPENYNGIKASKEIDLFKYYLF